MTYRADVLDGLYGGHVLHVDVALKRAEQEGVVGGNPGVGELELLTSDQLDVGVATVLRGPSPVLRKTLSVPCLANKVLRELEAAAPVPHAAATGIQLAARPVQHVLDDQRVKLGINLLVWDLGPNDCIDFVDGDSFSQPDQKVHMWQTPENISKSFLMNIGRTARTNSYLQLYLRNLLTYVTWLGTIIILLTSSETRSLHSGLPAFRRSPSCRAGFWPLES